MKNDRDNNLEQRIAETEKEGQQWFNNAVSLMQEETMEEFYKHMEQAKEKYYNEYEMLGCVGSLTEKGASLKEAQLRAGHSQFIESIERQDVHCLAYRIKCGGGSFGFAVLSSAYPQLQDGCIDYHAKRQSKCHEKAFEIAKKLADHGWLVCGYVSVLGDKHRYLHSRVEVDNAESVFDYTINAIVGIDHYNLMMHAEPPLIKISNKDIKGGAVSYDDFAKAILEVYSKTKRGE